MSPTCEFCESSYNESKSGQCYQCECGREGRCHPDVETMRECCEEFGSTLRDIGLSERKKLLEAQGINERKKKYPDILSNDILEQNAKDLCSSPDDIGPELFKRQKLLKVLTVAEAQMTAAVKTLKDYIKEEMP